MKFLRFPVLMLAGLMVAVLTFGQNADKILTDSKTKFNSLADMKATVTYTVTNPSLAKPTVKQGSFTIKKVKYKVVFPGEEIFCNGTFVWTYISKDKTTTKLDFDPEESLSPDRVFRIYKEETKTSYDGLEGNRHKISVFSSKETNDIWKTVVWVNKTTNLVEKASLYGRNGSVYTYELSSIVLNSGVADTEFNYDEGAARKAGIYINDLTGE